MTLFKCLNMFFGNACQRCTKGYRRRALACQAIDNFPCVRSWCNISSRDDLICQVNRDQRCSLKCWSWKSLVGELYFVSSDGIAQVCAVKYICEYEQHCNVKMQFTVWKCVSFGVILLVAVTLYGYRCKLQCLLVTRKVLFSASWGLTTCFWVKQFSEDHE